MLPSSRTVKEPCVPATLLQRAPQLPGVETWTITVHHISHQALVVIYFFLGHYHAIPDSVMSTQRYFNFFASTSSRLFPTKVCIISVTCPPSGS
jgi:hypothetical protein